MVRHAPSLVNYARWVGGGYWKVEFCCDQEKAHQGDRKGSISTCVCFLPDMVQLWRICAVFFYFSSWLVRLEGELRPSLLLILFMVLVPGNI
jgi:hypothetical protein